jgi:hypothetical protein
MIKERIAGLGEFEFYEDYFIGRIYDGVNAGSNFVGSLSDLIQKHYSGRPIIYISDRVNSYSLDPIATNDLIRRNNIRFAGVVAYSEHQKNLYVYEEQVFQGVTMCSFDALDVALRWAEQKSLDLRDVCTTKETR